jgi:hypothetical protein
MGHSLMGKPALAYVQNPALVVGFVPVLRYHNFEKSEYFWSF